MSRWDCLLHLLPQALALLATIAATTGAAPAAGATCGTHSAARAVALVELYTSEGCDSCPPADRWLAAAFRANRESTRAVPLAFHVDYWDRLGWRDRFAAPANTERQYAEMRAGGARFVYTPQVLIQGRDFQGWQGSARRFDAAVAGVNALPARADIDLEVQPRRDGIAVRAEVRVGAAADRKGAVPFLALADSDLVSDVKAGENAGARLTHDHVVRAFAAGPPVDAAGVSRTEVVLPRPSEAGARPTIVAFVQNSVTGEVLQTVALPLEGAACAGPD